MSIPTSTLTQRIGQATKVMGITEDLLLSYLGELGVLNFNGPTAIIDDEALAILEADTTHEGDARAIMVDKGSVKIARFKAGWAILKGRGSKTEVASSDTAGITGNLAGNTSEVGALLQALKPVAQYKDEELLRQYGEDASSEVVDELRKRAQGKAFIVFEDGKNTVDIPPTLTLLRQARRGSNTPATFMVGDRQVRVCQVGEFPLTFFEECPVHSNVLLVEGYCEECQNHWGGVSPEHRVWVRVALPSFGFSPIEIHGVISQLREGKNPFSSVPLVRLKYTELAEDDNLPKLRRRLSKSSGSSDPFFIHKTY